MFTPSKWPFLVAAISFLGMGYPSFSEADDVLPTLVPTLEGNELVLNFASQLGKEFQLRKSNDLRSYSVIGQSIGSGEMMTLRYPITETPVFFRLHEIAPLIGYGDVLALEAPPPDHQIAYGPDELQFGRLRLPDSPGPHPVVLWIHGGCWLASIGIDHTASIEAAIASLGFAVWSLEYRRVGDVGGGWPGTFTDIGRGADHLRQIADTFKLDLNRVVASGHSAGGHLALWLAARNKLPVTSDLYTADPLDIHGVLGLAPAPDLEGLYLSAICGFVINGLMGGSPIEYPQRYAHGSPMQLAPVGVPQKHVIGLRDLTWAPVGRAYVTQALEAGDSQITVIDAPEAGHFEMIAPNSSTWPLIQSALEDLFSEIAE